MSSPQVTPTLAQSIRAKFPGQYDDMDDASLEQKVLAKYPQYSDMPRMQTAPNAGLSPGSSSPKIDVKPVLEPVAAAGNALKTLAGNTAAAFGGRTIGSGGLVPEAASAQPMSFRDILKNASLKNAIPNIRQSFSDFWNPQGQDINQKVGGGAANLYTLGATIKAGANAPKAAPRPLAEAPSPNWASEAGANAYQNLPFLGRFFASKARAGEGFNAVKQAAGNSPIDVSGPGNAALETQRLASAGGAMPKVVRDFIKRTTDPNQGPLTYSEARDFYSNATRISADEAQRLTPVMRRQLINFTQELGNSIKGTANQAGVGPQYQGAMQEFAQASRNAEGAQQAGDFVKNEALRYLPWLAGGYAAKKVFDATR